MDLLNCCRRPRGGLAEGDVPDTQKQEVGDVARKQEHDWM